MTSILPMLYGPTASGKSALALAIAREFPIVIINADAMQSYRDLRIITARPSTEEEAAAPHALYGTLDAAEHGHVADWIGRVRSAIAEARADGRHPLLVGGTGMYMHALAEGIHDVPPIPPEIRHALHAMPPEERLARLREKDPVAATHLKAGDTQRIFRALEVVEATGKPLAKWQSGPKTNPIPDAECRVFTLLPERATIYAKINTRFEAMMDDGAIDEVEALMARNLPATLPIMRAHGVPEIMAMLRGEMPKSDAIAQAQQNTRHYAKRQLTWARNQFADAHPAETLRAHMRNIMQMS
jgi:tRNA dimethylallyltransferase